MPSRPDALDRLILKNLQEEARITNTELARRVGLSVPGLQKRIRKLESQKVIRGYVTLLNPIRLGYDLRCFVLVRQDRHDPELVRKFIFRMNQIPEVLECHKVTGEYDFLLKVILKNTRHLERFLVEILTPVPGVGRILTILGLQEIKYTTALPLGTKLEEEGELPVHSAPSNPRGHTSSKEAERSFKPDKLDRLILENLQGEARITNTELAIRAGLSVPGLQKRLKKLESYGAIQSFVTLVNPSLLGYDLLCFALVRLDQYSPKYVDEFASSMAQIPEVLECQHITGNFDFLLKVVVRDRPHLDQFLVESLTPVPGVGRVLTSLVLREIKNTTILPLNHDLENASERV